MSIYKQFIAILSDHFGLYRRFFTTIFVEKSRFFSIRPFRRPSGVLLSGLILAAATGFGQRTPPPPTDFTQRDPLAGIATDNWLRPAPEFNGGRFYTAVGTGTAIYGLFSYGLYDIWYKDFPRSSFHTFDDWPEWNQMDKGGHFFSAYMYSKHVFAGLRWAGLRRPAARYATLGVANLLQGTIEVFDGFSEEWGFSWTDMGANVAGSLVFTLQDIAWREQRMLLKVSNDLRGHPDVPVTNRSGAASNLGYPSQLRFGDYPFERYIKDYNALTYWLSVNPAAFAPGRGLPQWLNLAVGYGSENVYGAYSNSWRENGQGFSYPERRYRQWFLSPDIYLSRIPTRKRWVRLALGMLDFLKVPAPALEYSRGKFRGHWLMW